MWGRVWGLSAAGRANRQRFSKSRRRCSRARRYPGLPVIFGDVSYRTMHGRPEPGITLTLQVLQPRDDVVQRFQAFLMLMGGLRIDSVLDRS